MRGLTTQVRQQYCFICYNTNYVQYSRCFCVNYICVCWVNLYSMYITKCERPKLCSTRLPRSGAQRRQFLCLGRESESLGCSAWVRLLKRRCCIDSGNEVSYCFLASELWVDISSQVKNVKKNTSTHEPVKQNLY